LHFVTLQGEQRQAPVNSIDRALTSRLNRDRQIDFRRRPSSRLPVGRGCVLAALLLCPPVSATLSHKRTICRNLSNWQLTCTRRCLSCESSPRKPTTDPRSSNGRATRRQLAAERPNRECERAAKIRFQIYASTTHELKGIRKGNI
jgi:hypothetical protein